MVPCLSLDLLQEVALYDQNHTQEKTQWSLMTSGFVGVLKILKDCRISRCWAIVGAHSRKQDLEALLRWFVAKFGDDMEDRMLKDVTHPSLPQFLDAWRSSTPQERSVVQTMWTHVHTHLGAAEASLDTDVSAEDLARFVVHLENTCCFPNVLRRILDEQFRACVAQKRSRKKKRREAKSARVVANPRLQGQDYSEEMKAPAKLARVTFITKKSMDLAPLQNRCNVTEKRDFYFHVVRTLTACHDEDTWQKGRALHWDANRKVCFASSRVPCVHMDTLVCRVCTRF